MTSGRVAVIADSACDLPPDLAASHSITLVPLTVAFGTEGFLDGVEMTARAFWDLVRTSPEFPTTASPSPQAIADAYGRAAAEGATGVVSIHVSSGVSRTAATARTAAATSSVPVVVVDSLSVSLGQGLVALEAARVAQEGEDLEAVAGAARSAAERTTTVALLDSIDFLQRGGRVGRARAALSDLLRIRPVLTLDDGVPTLAAKARTRRRGIEDLLARVRGPADASAVFHADAPEHSVVEEALERETGAPPLVALVGAVTGTHLGPGALGVAVLRPVH